VSAQWNKPEVLRWMRINLEDHRDRVTGEVNLTALAEAAAAEWGQDHEDGPLDDPDHWVWEAAVEVVS
jgi:hypothetical protein